MLSLLQPAALNHATTPVESPCWDVDVPKLYIHCTDDQTLFPWLQMKMLDQVRDETWTVEDLDASHSPFLSKKEELVDIVLKGL